MLIMKSLKQQLTEGIDLPNQGKVRTLGEKLLGNIGSGHHQTNWDERKKGKRMLQEN